MTDLNCNDLNATECLLRVAASILEQLKEDSNTFNWDPASFVVTLAIGIIAAAFAFFAFIQGCLAAGPGRHKCSKYAIGTWATLSERKFDWSELRYRSIAQTPVIRIQDLLDKIIIPSDGASTRPEWNEHVFFRQGRHFSKLQYVTKEMSDYFPATWLRLLTHAGLHHPELWETNPQGTDYLPSDLAAAPAYSTVADLITVASIIDGRIQFNSIGQGITDEISIQGEYLDLNFRSHPLLGVYAAIDQAGPFGNDIIQHISFTYCRPDAKTLVAKLAYSQGFLQSVQHLYVDWDLPFNHVDWFGWSARGMKYLSKALVRNIYKSRCGCETRRSSQEESVRDHREVMFECCHAQRLEVFSYDYGIADPLRIGDGDISMLAAAVPLTRINLFPKRLATIGDKFIFLVIHSRYCMKADVSLRENMIGGGEPETNTAPGLGSQSRPAFQVDKELKDYSFKYTISLGRPESIRTTHMFSNVDDDIIRQERGNIDETINSQGEITPNSLSSITNLISLQVRKLQDYDQNRQSGAPSVDEYFTNSCQEDQGLSEWAPGGKTFRFLEYMENIMKLWEKDGDSFKYPTEQVQHYLDDLLVYRATLIYMLLSQAADNSHILSNPEYYKLIPVI